MKSSVQTRIFISLTPDEARAAVNDAVDLQLCVRSALYQIDGIPVATLIEQNRTRLRCAPGEQLAAPRHATRGSVRAGRARRKHKQLTAPRTARRKPLAKRECIHCHQPYSSMGIGKHERACKMRPEVTA